MTQYDITIKKALIEGVNAARTMMDELRKDLMEAEIYTTEYNELEAQIDCLEDWIKELADALKWMNEKKGVANLKLVPGDPDGD